MKHKSLLYWGKTITYQIGYTRITLLGALLFFLMSMVGILFVEYRFFCAQSQKMIALQEQYHTYLDVVKKILHQSVKNGDVRRPTDYNSYDVVTKSDPDDTEINQTAVDFLVVNRQREYLKQSMFEYFKIQKLDFLLVNIDQQEWLDYTDQVLSAPLPSNRFFVKQKIKKRKRKKTINCVWPLDQQNFWLSSLFGPRKKTDGSWGFHYGIDMAAIKGTWIKAAHAGDVTEAGYVYGYGKTIVIQYNKNFKTRYAHLDSICVKKGKKIKKGQKIGTVGDTGFVRKSGKDGSHLHFEVYKDGTQIDPLCSLPIVC